MGFNICVELHPKETLVVKRCDLGSRSTHAMHTSHPHVAERPSAVVRLHMQGKGKPSRLREGHYAAKTE